MTKNFLKKTINFFLFLSLLVSTLFISDKVFADTANEKEDSTEVRAVFPIYESIVKNDKTNGSSDFILTLNWKIEDDEYHRGDYFKVSLPAPAYFPNELIGSSTPILDEANEIAGYAEIKNSQELLATFNEYVENKLQIKGTVSANFIESKILFGQSKPFEILINDEKPSFTPGNITGIRSTSTSRYVLVKGALSLNNDNNTIAWYAMLNVNQSDARNIKYSDMPHKGHKVKANSIRVQEVEYGENLKFKTIRRLSPDEYQVKVLPDESGIERGFELTLANENPASYYVSYTTELVPEELKSGIIQVNENSKPIFENDGKMEWEDADGKSQSRTDSRQFTAKNFAATIEGVNKETSTATTTATTTTTTTTTTATTATTITTATTTTTATSTSSSTETTIATETTTNSITESETSTSPSTTAVTASTNDETTNVSSNETNEVTTEETPTTTIQISNKKETTQGKKSMAKTGEDNNEILLLILTLTLSATIICKKRIKD